MATAQEETAACPGGCGEVYEGWVRFCWACNDYIDNLRGGGGARTATDATGAALDAEEESGGEEGAPLLPGMPEPVEADIRQGVVRTLRSFGFAVYDLEQGHRPFQCKHCKAKIPGGSRVTEGFPDLFVTGCGTHFFVELKSAKGKRTREQEAFAVNVEDGSGAVFVWRSSTQAARWAKSYFEQRRRA